MKLTAKEHEIIRQALYSKAYKMEKEIERSFAKTGPSARLDRKGQEMEEVIALMKKVINNYNETRVY